MNKNLIALNIFSKKAFNGMRFLLKFAFILAIFASATIPLCVWIFNVHDHSFSNPWTSVLWGSMLVTYLGILKREHKPEISLWKMPLWVITHLEDAQGNYPYDISTQNRLFLEYVYQWLIGFTMPLGLVTLLLSPTLKYGLLALSWIGKTLWKTPSLMVKVRDNMIDGNPEEAARLEKKKFGEVLPEAMSPKKSKRL